MIKQNLKNIFYIYRPSDHDDKAVEVKENTEEEGDQRLITIFFHFFCPEVNTGKRKFPTDFLSKRKVPNPANSRCPPPFSWSHASLSQPRTRTSSLV